MRLELPEAYREYERELEAHYMATRQHLHEKTLVPRRQMHLPGG